MSRYIDRTGQRYGKLTVVSFQGTSPRRISMWLCLCDCGAEKLVRGDSLATGNTTSCGCYQQEKLLEANTKHGQSSREGSTSAYQIWQQMRDRCSNTGNKRYSSYGGRGITVCERWASFENFFADMGEKPDGLSLDREDNSKGYSPDNCRWATLEQQSNNTRRNRFVVYQGESLTVAQLAIKVDMKYSILHSRIKLGWDVNDAVTLPFQSNGGTKRKGA